MKRTRLATLTALFASAAAVASAQSPTSKPMFTVMPPHPVTHLIRPNMTSMPLPTWQGSFVYSGTTYSYTMVGTNPTNTDVTTTIQTYVIPVKMVYGASNGNQTFDPTVDRFSGATQSVLDTVLDSPVFSAATTFPEGKTQYGDAFQRGNFWSSVGATNTNYHVLLSSPTILPEMTVNVTSSQGQVSPNSWNGIPTGVMGYYNFDAAVQTYISNNSGTIVPDSVPIFILDNQYLSAPLWGCCIGGYHGTNGGGVAGQTYIVAVAVDPVMNSSNYPPFGQDVSALSHEVGEWIDDPFGNNIASKSGGCSAGSGYLEVGDPLEGLPDYGGYPYAQNGFTYHLQDLVFANFYGAPTTSFENRFTFQGENLVTCANTFAGGLSSNMDATNRLMRVFNLRQSTYPDENLVVNEYAFNGSSWALSNVGADAGVPPATLGSPILSYNNTIYNAPEEFYLASDSKGNEAVEQLWGVTFSPTSLTNQAGAQPAALGSALTGYIDPLIGTDNVFYQGTDQHLHDLTWSPSQPWAEDTRLAGEPVAAFGSALAGHMTPSAEEVFYIGTNQHVYELWRWSKTYDGWHFTDVTLANGSKPLAALGSPLAGYYDTSAGTDTIFYIGTDQHLHEMLFANSRWSGIDVTAVSGAPAPGVGSSLAAHMNTIANSEEVFFVAANQSVQETWSSAKAAPAWHSSNIFIGASGTVVNADPGTPLTAAIDTEAYPNTDEIDYIGTDGAVHQLAWTTAGGWTSVAP